MRKIKLVNVFIYFVIFEFLFSACKNIVAEYNGKIDVPQGYALITGSVSTSVNSRSAFAGFSPVEKIYYKVTATDVDGVLSDVTATLKANGPNMVIADTIIKTSCTYQLMLPLGTWNISVVGYQTYNYDAVNKIETYTTETFYAEKLDFVVSDTAGYHNNINFITNPALLTAEEIGTVNLPISITAASVLGARASWTQTIAGVDTPLTQTLVISGGSTTFTMIADDNTNNDGVPSGSYVVYFEFYDDADCTGTLLYSCFEAVNVLYKVITETNKWIKNSAVGSPHLQLMDSETSYYFADFVISDAILYDPLNNGGGYSGNGVLTLVQNDVVISVTNSEIDYDDPKPMVVSAKLSSDGTDITALTTNWIIKMYNIGGQDMTSSPYFTLSDKTITPATNLPYESEFMLYVSFDYNNCSYGGTLPIQVEPAYNFYSEPIDVSTGLKATAASTEVYFGVFPKTVLSTTSTVTINESDFMIFGGNAYYKGSDGEYYAKVLENASASTYEYSDESPVKQKTANSYRYFKLEPIKWKVLTTNYNDTGKALLHADMAIMCNIPFYVSTASRSISGTSIAATNYKYSTVRAYLNGAYEPEDIQTSDYLDKGFLQTVFKSKAQSLIVPTLLSDSSNVTDKIFLLSLSEVTSTALGFTTSGYGVNAIERIRRPTDYAKANYSHDGGSATAGAKYLLRGAPSGTSIRKVDHDGDPSDRFNTGEPTAKNLAIVPALCITLE